MSAPSLISTIVVTLAGVTYGARSSTGYGGELPEDVVAAIPADDLARRILSGDFVAAPIPTDDGEREWDRADLLNAHMKARGLVVDPDAVPDFPEGGMAPKLEASSHDDETADAEMKIAEAARLAEAEKAAAEKAAAEKASTAPKGSKGKAAPPTE